MTDRQEPLTPEEEAELRRDIAASNGPDDTVGNAVYGGPEDAEWMTARLLATLDAERAARQEAADPSELRAAADAVVAHWAGEHIATRNCSMQDDIDNLAELVGRPRAWPVTLSQEPTPDERPLDVEWFVREVVAYYKLYDHHEVWNERGARALGEWLAARLSAAGKDRP